MSVHDLKMRFLWSKQDQQLIHCESIRIVRKCIHQKYVVEYVESEDGNVDDDVAELHFARNPLASWWQAWVPGPNLDR